MIERKFVAQKNKEFQIQEMIASNVKGSGYSHTKLQRTPLGEKIIIFAARPGLIVGRKGQNISKLTKDLKDSFKLENPQIEISEIEKTSLDAQIVAESIAQSLERYGTNRFKGIMHKTMEEVMNAGALGIEITISGKIPGARAKTWRVFSGYLKKCGDVAISGVRKAQAAATLKSGVVGIKVSIMPPDLKLPDRIEVYGDEKVEEVREASSQAAAEAAASSEEHGKEKEHLAEKKPHAPQKKPRHAKQKAGTKEKPTNKRGPAKKAKQSAEPAATTKQQGE